MNDTNGLEIARAWDAGDFGCGALIAHLRREIDCIDTGTCLAVTARDAGACIDIPAWCQMTGHTLIAEQHPIYVISRTGG
jgi:tRNA 2-thiouridine synthesizing protein A